MYIRYLYFTSKFEKVAPFLYPHQRLVGLSAMSGTGCFVVSADGSSYVFFLFAGDGCFIFVEAIVSTDGQQTRFLASVRCFWVVVYNRADEGFFVVVHFLVSGFSLSSNELDDHRRKVQIPANLSVLVEPWSVDCHSKDFVLQGL